MKNFFTQLSILLFACSSIFGQATLKEVELPEEKLYVHINNSLAFAGQYLYFKIYTLKNDPAELSNISKIAYLNIIDRNKEVVHRQVVDLEKGMGYGDYFIPVEFASGNYKIIAYTNWMKNNPGKKYFEQDLFIINPYTSAQSKIRKDSIVYAGFSELKNTASGMLQLNSEYKNREEVHLDLSSLPEGNYSVSVRKLDSLPHPELEHAQGLDIRTAEKIKLSNTLDLPEARGKLISGTISTQLNVPLKSLKLALSIPGKEYYLRIAHPDENGKFFFSVDENFDSRDAMIQVLDHHNEDFSIALNDHQLPDLGELNFKDFGIDRSSARIILDHSVQNQIENAYFSLKPDTVQVKDYKNVFDGVDRLDYDLDDYTRFKTLKETFVEVVTEIQVRKRDEEYEMRVLRLPPATTYKSNPLVLVDGIILKDLTDFIEYYDARRIDKISIIRNNYFLGSAFFSSIVLFETFDSHFAENFSGDPVTDLKITSGNQRKKYFQQKYPGESENLPDYRTQLVWDPDLNSSELSEIEFFTSDVDGYFEVSIQGYSVDRSPVSITEFFSVK
ncbi:hypothetical protein E0K83_07115 [Gramella sp. BOM4]|nr:hypothetical protein [Christiangramia bathymodioli]